MGKTRIKISVYTKNLRAKCYILEGMMNILMKNALIEFLADSYDIEAAELTAVSPNNTAIKVETAVSTHLLKQYPEPVHQLEEKMILLTHLHNARKFDVIVPAVKGKNGRFSQTVNNTQVALYPFVDGQPIGTASEIPAEYETAVLTELVHLHDALYTTSFLPAVPDRPETALHFADELRAMLKESDHAEKDALLQELDELEALEPSLPSGSSALTHGNLSGQTILVVGNGRLKFTNWEDFYPAPAERDLCRITNSATSPQAKSYLRKKMPGAQLNDALLDFYARVYRLRQLMASE